MSDELLGPDERLDPITGDMDFSTGDGVMVVDAAQAITIRLKFFLAEWYLDQSLGLPYFQRMFVKQPNLAHLTQLYRKTILDTPSVQQITAFSLDYDRRTRRLSVSFACDTASGPVQSVVEAP